MSSMSVEWAELALHGKACTYDEGWLRMAIKTEYYPRSLARDDLVEMTVEQTMAQPFIARLSFRCPKCTSWRDFVARGPSRREAIETILVHVSRHGLHCDGLLGDEADYE